MGRRSLLASLLQNDLSVTVIGARRASRTGLEVAESLGRDLSAAGVVVVSGMALGIDSAAHRGALAEATPTIAVLGSGPDWCYPRRLAPLYERILERGLVVSEFPPGSEPRNWTFPARNRLMAALGKMTVVVEARRSSGSLITTSMAADLGREIGAVPGPVLCSNGEGVNALLHDGAHVIRNAADVLDILLGPGRSLARSERCGPELSAEFRRVLEVVERQSGTADQISLESPIDPASTAVALAKLEVSGYIEREGGGRFVRTALATPTAAL
jgi:DNA processing protein